MSISSIYYSSSIPRLSTSKLNPIPRRPRVSSGDLPATLFRPQNSWFSGTLVLRRDGFGNGKKSKMAVKCCATPGSPLLPDPGSWKIWIVGVLISVIFPFWKNKWSPLLRLKEEVEMVVETAEKVADIVEDVAEEVEKVAEEISHHLPEGGKLQKAAIFVENIARETDKYAHLAGDVIDKVQEVEEEVEALVKPVFNQSSSQPQPLSAGLQVQEVEEEVEALVKPVFNESSSQPEP